MSPAEYYTIVYMILAANVVGILLSFRRSLRENLSMLLACVCITALLQVYRQVTGDPIGLLTFLPGVWYLPSLFFIHKGSMAQKIFVTFTVLSMTHLLLIGVSFIAPESMLRRTLLLGAVLVLYVLLMAWQGRRFTEKVFSSAGGSWWGYALYTGMFYLIMIRAYGIVITPPEGAYARSFFYLLPFFAFAGLALFFVAILRTYEKVASDLELDFARRTLNTGRSYYENLTGTLEQVRLLQHDYKHQLAVLSGFAHDGNRREEALRHLDSMILHYEKNETVSFTANAAIDALLSHYAAQIRSAGVEFLPRISLPDDTGVDNYDLCIVLGNLLDNALTAAKQVPEHPGRYVKADVRYKAPQVVIHISNSFQGDVLLDEQGTLLSPRVGGGGGTRSVRAVVQKYGGVYENEWENGVFSAYVLLGK